MNFSLATRQQKLLLVVGVLVGLWASEFFVFGPLWDSWKARARRIADLQKKVSDGESILRREDGLRSAWDRMRTNTLSRDVSIAQIQVVRAFDSWSRESGVSVGGIRPNWKRTDEIQTLECRADVTGNLPALSRFLYQAEIDPLGIRIESIELTVRDKTGDQLALALQVSALQLEEDTR